MFNKDDTVMYHESERGTVAKHLPKKLAKNASGPHRVLRRIDSNRYVIHHRGRNCEVIVSVKDISKYHPFCKYEDEEKVETKHKLEKVDLLIKAEVAAVAVTIIPLEQLAARAVPA